MVDSHRIGRLARLRQRLKQGARDERGAVAVMFAGAMLLLIPLVMCILELYISAEQKGKLQDALDAAALFAARSNEQTDAAIDKIGDAALAANLTLMSGATLKSSDFKLVGKTVVATAALKPPALAPLIWTHPDMTVTSEVVRSEDKLEIALVLDNTGSMQGTKITTLKSAGKELVDKLTAAAANSTVADPIKISLVPFSNTVRVQGSTSLATYNINTHSGPGIPAWIDPQGKQHQVGAVNYDIFSSPNVDRLSVMKGLKAGSTNVAWEGCVEMRRAPYDVLETTPTGATASTMYVPYFWPDESDPFNISGTNFSGWYNDYLTDTGITTSNVAKTRQNYASKYPTGATAGATAQKRTGTFTLDSTAYGGPYTYGPNAGCVLQPVIRLTTNMATVKTAMDNMVAVGETNIPIGMAWGWNTLSPIGPWGDGAAYTTDKLKKIVILMTDGENTMNDPSKSGEPNASFYHGYGYVWQNMLGIVAGTSATRTSKIDDRLALLCTNMKAKGIIIYTVRVEVTTGTSDLLKGCASGNDKFFDVQNVSQLSATFDSIAHSIHNLRISK